MLRKISWLAASLLLSSCNSELSEIGSDFFDSGEMQVVYNDTLTVRASTVIFDSLNTYSPDRLLAGYYNDPDLGPVTARAYFEVYPNITQELNRNRSRYSRATVTLAYDSYSYYDTSVQNSLYVHQLTQRMQLYDDKLYATNSFTYSQQPIGSITFLPKPQRADTTLEIPLSDELGEELFELVRNSSSVISSAENFLKFFNGIVITPDQEINGSIVGFHKDPEIRIYYFDETTTPITENYLEFTSVNSIKFNQIHTDRSATNLSALKLKKEKISSSETEHTVYMQAGAGLGIRIEIPYLKDILLGNPNIIISDAILQMVPVAGSYRKNARLPETMRAFGNDFRNEVYFSNISTDAYLIEDVDLGKDTRYEADISAFVIEQLEKEGSDGNALIFSMLTSDFRFSVDRVYIGDQESEFRMKLLLRYIVVNE
jgi:hypothetical protein